MCSSKIYPYPPRRALLLQTPTLLEFPFHGVLVEDEQCKQYTCLKTSNSKITENLLNRELLFMSNSPILPRPPEKETSVRNPLALGNCLLLEPPPLGISVALR